MHDAVRLAEAGRCLEFRVLARSPLRHAMRIAGWLALASACAVAIWVWISGDGPAGALIARCGVFPAFFVAAWAGLAVFRWIAEVAWDAWDAWDLLFGED